MTTKKTAFAIPCNALFIIQDNKEEEKLAIFLDDRMRGW